MRNSRSGLWPRLDARWYSKKDKGETPVTPIAVLKQLLDEVEHSPLVKYPEGKEDDFSEPEKLQCQHIKSMRQGNDPHVTWRVKMNLNGSEGVIRVCGDCAAKLNDPSVIVSRTPQLILTMEDSRTFAAIIRSAGSKVVAKSATGRRILQSLAS
jgi:hypothetical protein